MAITMVKYMNIVPNFVGACALSGSYTVAPYHDIRKLTAAKKIREGAQLKADKDVSANSGMATEQAALLITDWI